MGNQEGQPWCLESAHTHWLCCAIRVTGLHCKWSILSSFYSLSNILQGSQRSFWIAICYWIACSFPQMVQRFPCWPQKPNGAVAMAATGVSKQPDTICALYWMILFQIERAFSMFEKTGKRDDVGQFSFERVGTVVDDYVTNSQKFSDRCWSRIMESCGAQVHQEEATSFSLNAPSMSQSRRQLYVPSSPMKEEWIVNGTLYRT